MATYAIGDVQGCFESLQALLQKINFNTEQDTLWFAGDLINRGPQSLAVLRFVSSLPCKPVIVLGNHDLHFLAVASGTETERENDTFQDVLAAPDCAELCDFLRRQKLFHYDKKLNYSLVHAGVPPHWTISDATIHSKEIETILKSGDVKKYLKHMYGDSPDHWSNDLKGWDRLRMITNYLTRMRFCTVDGRIDLHIKGKPGHQPEDFIPWFEIPNRLSSEDNIIFGHWASLEGKTNSTKAFALDTGCAWGGTLTAMRLEDQVLFSVPGL